MLDFNDLAMFVHVVRAGSFSEAARRLHMPTATLSRRNDRLEGQLGTRLLHRSTRKLAPQLSRPSTVRALRVGARPTLRDRTAQRR